MKRALKQWILAAGLLFSIAGSFDVNGARAQDKASFEAQVIAGKPLTYLDFNDATTALEDQGAEAVFVPSSTGVVSPRQPGFDNTDPRNKSASFTYDAYLVAMNNTTGNFATAVSTSPWRGYDTRFSVYHLLISRDAIVVSDLNINTLTTACANLCA